MSAPEFKLKSNTGTLVISAFFVFAGAITLYDTTGYSDIDSKVFPQTVAIFLVISALIAFVTALIKPAEEEGFGNGIWWRRALLVAAMLVACLMMPYIGFLYSGLLAFAGCLIAAMHDQWSPKTGIVYSLAGIVIITAFYTLFRYGLLVPLP